MIDITKTNLLTINSICSLLKISRVTLERWRKDAPTNPVGQTIFPEPDLYVGGMARWTIETVNKWVDENKNNKPSSRQTAKKEV
jgi:predicted DNA-binding transcriptional regulator AlpA